MIITKSELKIKLINLGLTPGQVVLVHSSLSEFGYVLGGAQTIISVLLDILGEQGTLVMPAFSPQVSDPSTWSSINFDENELKIARKSVPVFDKSTTPTTMGHISEVFRNWTGTLRSSHPQVSVCANGLFAKKITSLHKLEWGEGRESPFERLVEMNTLVLLLGVGFNRITLLHYAESLVANGRRKIRRIPMMENEYLIWEEYIDVGDDLDTHFPIIGKEFIKSGNISQLNIGKAFCSLMNSKDLIDFSVNYFENIFSKHKSEPLVINKKI
jgi:aminoglycoside 3-N-acetyltransferase